MFMNSSAISVAPGHLMQNQDFGLRRKIWILDRKCRFDGFRHRWFQIFRPRNEIQEELEKSIKLGFWKWISRSQNPNSQSKSWFWCAKFWFWKRIFWTKFWKTKLSNFGRALVPFFQNFEFRHQIKLIFRVRIQTRFKTFASR